MALTIICFLTGAALGMRFKILIVIPVIGLALLGTAAVGIANGSPIGSTMLIMVLVATTLQLGYLAGVVSRHVLVSVGMVNAAALGSRDPSVRDKVGTSGATLA
jgi:hypothetical protein